MISVDISRLLEAPVLSYLWALMPGLFFEISVYLADPSLVGGIVSRARAGFPLGYYSSLAVAVVLAFIVGNALMWFVSFINWLLGYTYRFMAALRRVALSQALRRALVRVQQWLARRRIVPLAAFLSRVMNKLRPPPDDFQSEVYRCLGKACASLLRTRYGMEEAADSADGWRVWYAVLGRPTENEARRAVGAAATQATGWAGVAAMYFTPSLRSGYYEVLSCSLVFFGALQAWYAAKRLFNPEQCGLTTIRRVLAELRGASREYPKPPDPAGREPR